MNDSNKIKVLHVVGAMNRAGTETMLMNIYRHINLNLFQFDFISYDKEAAHYDREIESLNGNIIRLTKTNSIKEIYNALIKHGPYDVVHSHTLFHCGIVNVAAFFAGVKIRIAHAHTTLDKSDSFIRKLYILWMRRMINIFSTDLLACSKEAGQYLFGEKTVEKDKYIYFPNTIDYSRFLTVSEQEVEVFKQENDLGNKGIVIGHIGTFKESKNHLFLLAIMKCLTIIDPTATLLLVGDGELKPHIKAKAIQLEIIDNIKFIGTTDNIPTILYSMDVFIFPSIYEGLGLVLLEAQASGVPCLVSEAIQPEADLGLGLIEKYSLSTAPALWAEQIMKLAIQKEKNINKIINHFEDYGYSLTSGIERLTELYNSPYRRSI